MNSYACDIWQRLEESITKNSPTLGRDAVYSKSVSVLYSHDTGTKRNGYLCSWKKVLLILLPGSQQMCQYFSVIWT